MHGCNGRGKVPGDARGRLISSGLITDLRIIELFIPKSEDLSYIREKLNEYKVHGIWQGDKQGSVIRRCFKWCES